MRTMLVLLAVWLGFGLAWAEENYQQWSVQTHENERYSFTCNDTLDPVYLNPDDLLTWRRHGHDASLLDDDFFELSDVSGIQNMKLTIKRATEEMSGVYFCEIYAPTGGFVARVVKGLNVGGYKYDGFMDKYRSNVITGAVTAASVLFLVLGLSIIDHFRWHSPEERLEKQEAKEERIRRKNELKSLGHDNLGMEVSAFGEQHDKHTNGGFQNESNTQF